MSHQPRIEYQKRVDGRRAGTFIVTEAFAADVDRLFREHGYGEQSHGNAREVVIYGEIDTETYAERVKHQGAMPIEYGQRFPSARAASLHFGLNPDAVSIAINRAKVRGEHIAIVSGVPVCFVESLGGD